MVPQAQKDRERASSSTAVELAEVRARILTRERYARYVLHPERDRILGYWDGVTGFALLFTAVVTPWDVGFSQDQGINTLFFFDRVLDLIFISDLVLQFFLAYQANDEYGGTFWVEDRRRIAMRYLKRWFSIDLTVCVVPLTFDIITVSEGAKATSFLNRPSSSTAGLQSGSSSSSSSSQPFALLRFLRLLRLAKLVRLLRASRLYNRWIKRVTLSTGTLTLIQCFVGVSLTTHWWACIIGLQTMLHADVPQTWLGPHAYNYCPTLSAAAVNASSGSVGAYFTSCPSLDPATFYLASLTWAMLLISGTGGTDYYPSSTSNGETMVVGALTILGALLWTYVLALFVEHVTNANPGLTQFHQLLDGLNDYISYHRLPHRMGERMREYLHQQKGVQLHLFDERALHSLSKTMQIEVTLHVHRRWLSSVGFLRGLELPLLVRLAQSMRLETMAPGDVASSSNLYVIERGLVLHGARVLTAGNWWGEDVLLSDPAHRLPYLARALAYVDLRVLEQRALFDAAALFPASYANLRRRTILLALRRHIIALKRKADREDSIASGLRRLSESGPSSFYALQTTASHSSQQAFTQGAKEPVPEPEEDSVVNASKSMVSERKRRRQANQEGGRKDTGKSAPDMWLRQRNQELKIGLLPNIDHGPSATAWLPLGMRTWLETSENGESALPRAGGCVRHASDAGRHTAPATAEPSPSQMAAALTALTAELRALRSDFARHVASVGMGGGADPSGPGHVESRKLPVSRSLSSLTDVHEVSSAAESVEADHQHVLRESSWQRSTSCLEIPLPPATAAD